MILISLLSVAVYFSVSASFNFKTTGLNVADRFIRIRSATAAHSQRIIFVLDDQFRAKSILVLQYSIIDYIVFQHLFIFYLFLTWGT
jgi:hypothetical protein